MIPNIGPTELIILLTIVLLLFGAKRIPALAKGLGSGVREFKRGVSGRDDGRNDVAERDEEERAGLPDAETEARDEKANNAPLATGREA